MKAFKRISLALIAFLALAIIRAAETLPDAARAQPWIARSLFFMLLIGSFVYLHWLFLQFALPLDDVSPSTRKDILSGSKLYYSRGRILVGIGYFLLFGFISLFFAAPEGMRLHNTLIPTIIFIVAGIFVRIRAVVIYLAEHYIKSDMRGV